MALRGEWRDPIAGQGNLVRRVLDFPYYYISLHSRQYDHVRYNIVWQRGRYYETTVTDRFHAILRNEPPGLVLDVGANVGVYTLLSASLGHSVASFEINPANLIRLCESLWLNGWADNGRVRLFQRGVSSRSGTQLKLVVPLNPGQAHMVPLEQSVSDDSNTVVTVNTITLDDLAQSQGWIASKQEILLLKMDVEGVEPSVVAGAQQLLRSGIVRNVLTEVKEMPRPEIQTMLRTLLDCGYVVRDEALGKLTREQSERYLAQQEKKTRATFYRKDKNQDLWFQKAEL